jgi:hypothetical protein
LPGSVNSSRADRPWPVVAASLLLLAAAPTDCVVTLTPSALRATCPLPADHPLIARIPVQPVENPGQVPIDVRIALLPEGGVETPLQSVSLFPADRPGTFALRLPRTPGAARLVFALSPDAGRVVVHVGPVTYQYEEPR